MYFESGSVLRAEVFAKIHSILIGLAKKALLDDVQFSFSLKMSINTLRFFVSRRTQITLFSLNPLFLQATGTVKTKCSDCISNFERED